MVRSSNIKDELKKTLKWHTFLEHSSLGSLLMKGKSIIQRCYHEFQLSMLAVQNSWLHVEPHFGACISSLCFEMALSPNIKQIGLLSVLQAWHDCVLKGIALVVQIGAFEELFKEIFWGGELYLRWTALPQPFINITEGNKMYFLEMVRSALPCLLAGRVDALIKLLD